MNPVRLTPLAAALAVVFSLPAVAQTAAATPAPAEPAPQRVEVVGTAPLPGQGVARDTLPYTTQVLRRQQVEEAGADHLGDLLARRLPGVQLNDIQGSPFQGDLSYRGYRASGLLGAAQGLSVYLDGIRINEPFGDVVNWDMVPEFALDSVSLVPGANPAFGLNTLGGALSLRTADARSAPGWRAEASVGSFGRRKGALSHGGTHADGWEHYVAASGFAEDGWRDHSSGQLGNVLAKVGRRWDEGDFSLGLLKGSSRLIGNGLVPWVSLDTDTGATTPDLGSLRRQAVYTHPDETRNRLTQLSAQAHVDLDARTTLEALAWQRRSDRDTVNGDVSDEDPPNPAANASLNQTRTWQRARGVSLGLSGRRTGHQWQVGASWEQARVSFQQAEQEGVFDATRGVQALGDDATVSAQVAGTSRTLGLLASDTWTVQPGTHLTGALRLNHTRVGNQLDVLDDATGLLESQPQEVFSYRSLNPALGVAHKPAGSSLTWFANLARNTRVPTVIELGCANPDEPCRLPAGLQSDPYLKQVRSTTLEAGLRFGQGGGSGPRGSVALYRSDNRDDILFRSVSSSGQLGYFQNFGLTRHLGLDADVSQRWGAFELSLAYSWLRATYEAEGVLRMGERNVEIEEGTPMAGVPRHTLKLALDWRAQPGWLLGLDVQALGSRGVSGNEDGLLEDGADETHRLRLPGYAVVNLRGSWKPTALPGLELFAKVSNLFDRRYATWGQVASTRFDAQGQWQGQEREALFVAPGAPRAAWVGARVAF